MSSSEPVQVAPEEAAAVESAEGLVPEPVREVGGPAQARGAGGGAAHTDGAGGSADGRPNRRKIREGLVASTSMEKTVVVAVVERVRHPRYAKTVQRTTRLLAHNEDSELKVGDRVRLAETRPLSKRKRWRVVEVLERAK